MIAPMVKMQLAAPAATKEQLLLWLQDQEVIHVEEMKLADAFSEPVASDTPYQLAELEFVLDFIQRIRKELQLQPKRSWKNLFVNRPAASLAKIEQTLHELQLVSILAQVRQISDTLARLAALGNEKNMARQHYEPWQALAITGQELAGTATSQLALITVGIQEEKLFKALLSTIPTATWQEVKRQANKKGGFLYLEVVIHKDDAKQLQAAVLNTSATFTTLSLGPQETIAAHLVELKREITTLKRQYQEALVQAKQLFSLEKKLQFAYDALLHRLERETLQQKVVQLPSSYVITGWIPQHRYRNMQRELDQLFPVAALEKIPTATEDKPPVLFKNSKLVQPFEAVTNIYGKPQYSELDPSPWFSIFFLIAFGLALTDAGYGLLIMLTTWAAEKFFRLKREMRKMVRLFFYGGAMTVVLGALTGGWFGLVLEELPSSVIRDMLLKIKLLDPIAEPMTLLGAIFAIGVTQLMFAWIVRGYDHYRKRDYPALLFDDIAWFTLLSLILLWLAAKQQILIPAAAAQLILWVLYANLAVLVLTQGRSYKNIFLRLASGALSLYGLISFMSDMLSYSRLLALGLATGIIGLVVNLLGSMAADTIPVVGSAVAVIILIIGHVFNLSINALGAFIHSGRLQFVEFFPKFIEGGGAPYRPFGRVSKYVDNPNEFIDQ